MLPALTERLRWEHWRERLGRRATGIVAALVAEVLLILLMLTLAPDAGTPKGERRTTFSFSPTEEKKAETEQAPAERQPQTAAETRAPDAVDPKPAPEAPVSPVAPPPLPPTLIPMELARADIATAPPQAPAGPPAPRRGVAGPPDTGPSGFADTPRVAGSGPNGEPLYAAAWYREPYPEELRGYLSTAKGPGWGLIACRTAPQWRVEDCIALDEYPEGSNIARSVLAAAWQFKVRPPRLGGELKVGEWVRIRIDYDLR